MVVNILLSGAKPEKGSAGVKLKTEQGHLGF